MRLKTLGLLLLLTPIFTLTIACSDDSSARKDTGATPDSLARDSAADSGVDASPDAPISPDQGSDTNVKTDTGTTTDTTAPIDSGSDAAAPDAAPPAGNGTCATAQTAAVAATGKTTISGNTSGVANEFTPVSCGATFSDGTPVDFAGPQLYYKVTLTQGLWELKTAITGWTGALYALPVAAGCADAAAVDAGCKDHWSTTTLLLEVKQATEDWYLVIDSPSTTQEGAFAVEIEKLVTPTGTGCAAPNALTLVNGTASVQATTRGAIDEFPAITCGLTAGSPPQAFPFVGGQVYFKVTLEANKTYRATLAATADLALYAVPAPTACTSAAIDAACMPPAPADPQNVPASDVADTGNELVLIKTGAQPVDYLLVVDSFSQNVYDDFTLKLSEYSPAQNGSCATAQAVTLTTLPTTVSGDSTGLASEFSNVNCGLGYGPFAGPQAYYEVGLTAGKTYQITARDLTFDAGLYAFKKPATCSEAAVNSGCTSPASDPLNIWSADDNYATTELQPETIYITPAANETWIVVVDSLLPGAGGTFTLEVDELKKATNGSCATPQVVALPASPVVVSGDTGQPGLVDEYATVNCGADLADAMAGPQLYYKVSLAAGTTYTIVLAPAGWDGALYAFPAATACGATTVSAACKSPTPANPNNVYNSDAIGDGFAEQLEITPTAAGDWIIVVDSWSGGATYPAAAGPFTLTVSY